MLYVIVSLYYGNIIIIIIIDTIIIININRPSDCVDHKSELVDKLTLLSEQFRIMNSNLTVYVTGMRSCDINLKNIKFQLYNATSILTEYGFGSVISKMYAWKNKYTRLADIVRILLAHKYQMTYLDVDVHFLDLHKELYQIPFVSAALWSDNKNAIEITNAMFCLPKNILEDMIQFQLNRVSKGSDTYFYTELGPSMFHHVLINRYSIPLYSHNSPIEPSIDKIAYDIQLYGHKHLHLCGHVRKGNSDLKFSELVNQIREKVGLPKLS